MGERLQLKSVTGPRLLRSAALFSKELLSFGYIMLRDSVMLLK